MENICIKDLETSGIELLSDRESYLDEISSHKFDTINGGITPFIAVTAAVVATYESGKIVREVHDYKHAPSPIGWL